jgi:NitT/TauT family transport system ATP-binding protein
MPSASAAFALADQEKPMLDHTAQPSLLDIRGVCRSFPKGSGEELLVLEKVDLTIRAGEQVDAIAHHRRIDRTVVG